MRVDAKAKTKGAAVVGRPREFDVEAAAEKAMQVFWARGYEGASMAELTAAMGLSKPSVYAAFGDKQGLFRAAMQRYGEGPRGFGAAAMEMATAREAVEALLRGVVGVSTRVKGPKGCLQTQAALACGVEGEAVRDWVASERLAGEGRLRERLRRGQREGDLGKGVDVGALAKYVATVAQGITVQGAAGVSRRELVTVVEMAMRVWPAG